MPEARWARGALLTCWLCVATRAVGGRLELLAEGGSAPPQAVHCLAERLTALASHVPGEVCYVDVGANETFEDAVISSSQGTFTRSLLRLRVPHATKALSRLQPYYYYDKANLFVIFLDAAALQHLESDFERLQSLRYWDFQARLLIVYQGEEDTRVYRAIFSVLWAQAFFNVFLLHWVSQNECAGCECLRVYVFNPYVNSEDAVKPIQVRADSYTWTRNFNGYKMRLAMMDIEPYAYLRKNKKGKLVLKGSDGSLIRELLQYVNASYVVLRPDDNLPHGYFINKTINCEIRRVLNGAMGMVAYGEADIAVNSWMMDPAWRTLVEYLYPHEQDDYCMVVRRSKKVPFFELLFRPFSPLVWAFLGFSLFITSCCIAVIKYTYDLDKTSKTDGMNNKTSGLQTTVVIETKKLTNKKRKEKVNPTKSRKQMDVSMKIYDLKFNSKPSYEFVKTNYLKPETNTSSVKKSLGSSSLYNFISKSIIKNSILSKKNNMENKKSSNRLFSHSSSFHSKAILYLQHWGRSLFESYRMHLTQMFSLVPDTRPERLLFIALSFGSLTLISSYQTSIFSFLTVPVYEQEIDTLPQVDANFDKIYTYPYFLQVLKNVDSRDEVGKLRRKFVAALTEAEWALALRAVRGGEGAALLTRMRARFVASRRDGGRVRLAREPALSPAPAHLALRAAASPLAQLLNALLAAAAQAGLQAKWKSQTYFDFVLDGVSSLEGEQEAVVRKGLNLEQVEAAFQGLGLGLLTAAGLFVAEGLAHRAQGRRRRRLWLQASEGAVAGARVERQTPARNELNKGRVIFKKPT